MNNSPAQGKFSWQTASPESVGMDSAKLQAMQDVLVANSTKMLLIARHDRVVWEWYAPDFGPSAKHYTASLAKALVGGMSLALAMEDGLIHLDDLAADYIPAWRNDPLKSEITIRHLATHSSGLDDAKEGDTPHSELPGWKGEFWRQEPRDPFSITIHEVPVVFPPGSQHLYSNPGMAALAYAVTASIQKSPYKDIRTLLQERLMNKIGVGSRDWAIGYGKTFNVDGLPLVANWGGGAYTTRAAASVGRLMMRQGDWDGERILSPATVAQMLTATVTQGKMTKYTPCWYSNENGSWPCAPRDTYYGAGAQDQYMVFVPSLDLIIVRNGGTMDASVRDALVCPAVAAIAD